MDAQSLLLANKELVRNFLRDSNQAETDHQALGNVLKKYLSEEEMDIYREYMDDYEYCDDELFEGELYMYGRISMHNRELNRMFKKHKNQDGVDYDND
jgi:uncharacterized protein with NRDE domain